MLIGAILFFALTGGPTRALSAEDDTVRAELRKCTDILETGDWAARMQAVHELEYLQAAGIRGLALAAQDGDWQIRMTAITALGTSTGDSSKLLRKLFKKEECPVVSLVILHSLGSAAKDGEEARIMDAISSQNAEQVNGCADQPGPGHVVWAELSSPVEKAVPAPPPQPLAKLKTVDPTDGMSRDEGRYQDSGGMFGHDSVPDLIVALKKGDDDRRALAADALGHFGAEAIDAVKPLIAALGDKNPRVRSSAGLALGNIGADSAEVVPLLIHALKDRNVDVRYAAALALSRIGTPEARAAIDHVAQR